LKFYRQVQRSANTGWLDFVSPNTILKARDGLQLAVELHVLSISKLSVYVEYGFVLQRHQCSWLWLYLCVSEALLSSSPASSTSAGKTCQQGRNQEFHRVRLGQDMWR